MAIIVADDFESYSIGQTPASMAGSPWEVAGSTGTVVAGSPDGIGANSFQLGQLQFTGALKASVSHKFNVYLPLGGNINTAGLLQCQLGTGGYSVFRVGMNGDNTLFADVLASPFAHTTTYAGSTQTPIQFNTWYSIIANCIFSAYAIGPDAYVRVEVNVAIDGLEEIAVTVDTLAKVSDISPSPGITRWIFAPGTISGSVIDNIEISDTGGAIPPPLAVAPAKIHQAVIEVVKTTEPKARIYQAVIELVLRRRAGRSKVSEA